MTIPYSTSVPNAPNDPSFDQPDMKTNTQSINSIIGVDHVTFNTSGGGQHLQVTFNSNNVPTPPVSPPILFTNIQDGAGNNLPGGLPQIFFYSGDAAHSKNQYVSTTNGSTLLPGGMIMKWGTVNIALGFTQTITFPVAFPNNCFTVVPSISVSTVAPSTATLTVQAGAFTTTGFTLTTSSTSKITTICYIAIGN
jgi:hypothetical protein